MKILETEGNSAFGQIVRSHFHFHSVAREDADSVFAHASSEMAEEFVVFCFVGKDPDAECGVGERFLDNADELNDCFTHNSMML